ncbi:MAG TPA: hypothetical protein VM677_30105 [Actinokineospora sp.]|jgi:predicted nucleic acid-binding protein|nr:hypothetical protein [Actinokineospora sp.]
MPKPVIFDTGPLTHFARAQWLGTLKAVVGERRALIPDVVVEELEVGAVRDSRIQAVLDAEWIEHIELRTAEELQAYAKFERLLVYRNRNRGEAGALALAETMGGNVVVDDGAGRKAAEKNGIEYTPTLRLLCDAIRTGLLTVPLVSALADDLIISSYRLPFTGGGFEKWAHENNLIS